MMSDFVNTIDLLGDKLVFKALVERTIQEFNDDVATSIGDYAFQSCTALTSVNLPNATRIGLGAFQSCKALTSVNLPNVTGDIYVAFQNCTALTSINLPNATDIRNYAFYGCTALTSVDFSEAIRIRTNAFYNCKTLTRIILRKSQVCSLSNINAFDGTPFAADGTGGTVYVPQALITNYQQNATNWSTLYASGKCNFVAIEGSEYE